jgi:hypothetical protein
MQLLGMQAVYIQTQQCIYKLYKNCTNKMAEKNDKVRIDAHSNRNLENKNDIAEPIQDSR